MLQPLEYTHIELFVNLKKLWDNVQPAHDNYLLTTHADDVKVTGDDDTWITDIEEKFEPIEKLECGYIREARENEIHDSKIKSEKNSIRNQMKSFFTVVKIETHQKYSCNKKSRELRNLSR